MSYYFSPSQKPAGGFYLEGLHKTIPDDAVPLTREEWEALQVAIDQGQRVVVRGGAAVAVPAEEAMDVVELKKVRERQAKQARKDQEAQGVIVSGVRFGGSDKERIDLLEALEYAQSQGLTEFATWKDSDGVYHENLPVSVVQDGANQLRALRFQLISDEGAEVSRIRRATSKGEL